MGLAWRSARRHRRRAEFGSDLAVQRSPRNGWSADLLAGSKLRTVLPPRLLASGTLAERPRRFLTVSLARELGILLTLSVMFPFMIHILPVPDDVRLGPRLLPIFYAPLLASLLGRAQTAVIVAIVAPWLNWLLTRHPAPAGGVVMTVQLLTFVLCLRAMLRAVGPRWYLAFPAYIGCLVAAALVVTLFPPLIGGRAALEWFASTIRIGWPGIAILVLINWLAIRSYPTGSGPGDSGPLAV